MRCQTIRPWVGEQSGLAEVIAAHAEGCLRGKNKAELWARARYKNRACVLETTVGKGGGSVQLASEVRTRFVAQFYSAVQCWCTA